jgi:hypothetical protein
VEPARADRSGDSAIAPKDVRARRVDHVDRNGEAMPALESKVDLSAF